MHSFSNLDLDSAESNSKGTEGLVKNWDVTAVSHTPPQIPWESHLSPNNPRDSTGTPSGVPIDSKCNGTLYSVHVFCGRSDHIWQYQQIYKCYISSGTIFRCEFNGDVHCVIRVTIPANMQVLYIIWNHFSIWIQQWCLFCDQSDYIWQLRWRSFSKHCQGQDSGQYSIFKL